MLYRTLLHFFLLLNVAAAAAAYAQPKPDGPVTLAELRSILSRAEESKELIGPTNRELIAAVQERGVDFVLTPEEEWALRLREASDELIAALRGAIDPAEREFRLRVARQQNLYEAFARNFSSTDLTGKTVALNAGREFVAEYADDPNVAQIVAYMRRSIPSLERSVQILQRQYEMAERERMRTIYRESRRDNDRRGRRREEAQAQPQTAPPAGKNPPAQQNRKPR